MKNILTKMLKKSPRTLSAFSNASGVIGKISVFVSIIGLLFAYSWWIGALIVFAYNLGPVGATFGMALWNGMEYGIVSLLGGIIVLILGVSIMLISDK